MTAVSIPVDMNKILQPVKSHAKTLFWLGAGFSRCINPQAPLMHDFFVGFEGAKYPHVAKYLTSRYGKVDGVNVEDVLLVIDQIEGSPLPPRARADMMCGQDPQKIKLEIEQFCLERLSYDVPDYKHWAVNVLAMANELTTVVTTNYDVLAEQILRRRSEATHCGPNATCHHCNMRAILEDKCACSETGQMLGSPKHGAILKIHGSIAWRTCKNKACGITECLKSSCDCSTIREPKCECCGEEANPVIVLPSAKKSFDRFLQIGRMWGLAHERLSEAVAITVFGFSFPMSDTLVRDMFRASIAKSRNLREIYIIDVDPKAVWGRIESIIPYGMDVDVNLLDVPRDGTRPDWIG